jgi:hypothetical protein
MAPSRCIATPTSPCSNLPPPTQDSWPDLSGRHPSKVAVQPTPKSAVHGVGSMDISKLTLNHQSLLRNRMMPTIRSDAKSLQIGKKEEENRSLNPVFPKCDQINMVDVFAPVSPQQVRPNRYGSNKLTPFRLNCCGDGEDTTSPCSTSTTGSLKSVLCYSQTT